MPIKKIKKVVKSVGKAIEKLPKALLKGGKSLGRLPGSIAGGFLGETSRKMLAGPRYEPAEVMVEEMGSRAPRSFEPEDIKVGGAATYFKKGGLVKDKMGRAMKKPGADARGRAMTAKPKKMMGGGMKKPKKMMGGGMTRGYKRGGMAKKGC